ncbi:MAG: polyprenol phosphomannose-dependent alpha 1,6 mannosyltransferase MptB [Thermoleophilaceae bacterium]|nr:polyprenol phosphomannose-dependent alpha 1,6 mannosyltransferase MptB [Thermoleophilaceae bacterium]
MTDRPAARSRWATAALAALIIVFLWLAAAPAVVGSKVVLATAGGSPNWLLGVFKVFGADSLAGGSAGWTYYLPLMLSAVLWAIVVWLAPTLKASWLLWSVIGLHVVFLLAPPLLSQDIFSYIAYARLGIEHGLNPYAFRPFDIPGDPVFGFAGSKDAVDVYGPYFTLLTYPLAWVSVPVAFWSLKVIAATASIGLVLLVRSIAERVGADSARAIALVGLSPATLVHVVGGGHNEALTMLIVFAGISFALSRDGGERDATGGFISALALGVKASAAVPLVFMLAAARRKLAMFLAMAAAALLTLATGLIAFGGDALNGLNLISSNQDRSSRWSIPHRTVDGLDALFAVERGTATDVVRLIFLLLLAVVVACLIWRSYKLPETWLANAGWATVGVLIASAWLVPWYLLWLLPFAALGRCKKLQVATVILTAYTLAIAIPF